MTRSYLFQALFESVAGEISKHVTQHAVPALALEYALDYAGEEAGKRLKKRHPRFAKKYMHGMRRPKHRVGQFVSDLSTMGSTVAGVHLGGLKGGGILRKAVGGVAGHIAGRMAGNFAGKKINHRLYAKKRKK